ncbi:Xanthine dehydrogenase, iron-sulfur cluster and FAD-binding subunit A [Serinicoccus hydrothermalis]|uniref:Xanthine dehydrogenase, iron-sulfur cluster and FAD-binding subunit A n=1 Tax=Serinicoccus hydrothermalis TaxID=1758689 RepID=A0A1B1NDU1_9MICO|nr:FAD binding domain-containing protein [Serinicoccus hydrothermalis]ANS79609.1 Xanthine dehydrogenase, iron-sulfur cluster and FAD-binding subunit A [Serinicoccus hydrothermalis]
MTATAPQAGPAVDAAAGVEITANGHSFAGERPEPHISVLDWLRSRGLTGAKEGCAEGECGACSVLVRRPDGEGSRWTAINSCLVPAAALDGQEVITSEGLGSPEALHPVQQEMAERGGSQCGYCTPGFVCSMAAEFYRPGRTPAEADPASASASDDHECGPNGFDLHALSGNLCRCTGYRPIQDAAYALGMPEQVDEIASRQQQPAPAARVTSLDGEHGSFRRPADLAETLELLAEHPDAVLVAGSTDWGVELTLRHRRAPLSVAIDHLPELRTLTVEQDRIEIGAALSLSEIERRLEGAVPMLDQLFPQFASRLIRNGATLGGNLGTGSPIGDSPPALLALDARLVLTSARGSREVALSDYFTDYRRSVKAPDELIERIVVPQPQPTHVAFHKIAKRRFDDISGVAIAFGLDLAQDQTVRTIRIGLGGVAATPLRARATEELLTGRRWDDEAVNLAAATLGDEGTPMDDHRASAAYRAAMLRQSLLKFYVQTTAEVAR